MKKTINICDICKKNETDAKCIVCGKDVCRDCNYPCDFSVGDEEVFSLDVCEYCVESIGTLKKKDTKEIKKQMENILIPFLKRSAVLGELKSKGQKEKDDDEEDDEDDEVKNYY